MKRSIDEVDNSEEGNGAPPNKVRRTDSRSLTETRAAHAAPAGASSSWMSSVIRTASPVFSTFFLFLLE